MAWRDQQASNDGFSGNSSLPHMGTLLGQLSYQAGRRDREAIEALRSRPAPATDVHFEAPIGIGGSLFGIAMLGGGIYLAIYGYNYQPTPHQPDLTGIAALLFGCMIAFYGFCCLLANFFALFRWAIMAFFRVLGPFNSLVFVACGGFVVWFKYFH